MVDTVTWTREEKAFLLLISSPGNSTLLVSLQFKRHFGHTFGQEDKPYKIKFSQKHGMHIPFFPQTHSLLSLGLPPLKEAQGLAWHAQLLSACLLFPAWNGRTSFAWSWRISSLPPCLPASSMPHPTFCGEHLHTCTHALHTHWQATYKHLAWREERAPPHWATTEQAGVVLFCTSDSLLLHCPKPLHQHPERTQAPPLHHLFLPMRPSKHFEAEKGPHMGDMSLCFSLLPCLPPQDPRTYHHYFSIP